MHFKDKHDNQLQQNSCKLQKHKSAVGVEEKEEEMVWKGGGNQLLCSRKRSILRSTLGNFEGGHGKKLQGQSIPDTGTKQRKERVAAVLSRLLEGACRWSA